MSFIIMRVEDGKYVTRPGSAHSYTAKLQEADTFPTREAAEAGKCGNERVMTVEQAMGTTGSK